jgi:peptide/nickel transport system permease protein
MLRFVLRRTALVLPSLLGLLLVTFLLIHAVPADPAAALAGDAATPEQIARLRHQYGFDRPIYEQFLLYLDKVAHLDFGESAFSHRPVTLDIAQRLPATLELTFCALAISVFVGVPLGVLAALNHNAWPDYLLRVFSVLGIAMAAFWVAIMLQLLFSMQLGWLPLRGELTSTMALPPRVTGFLVIDCLIAGRWEAFFDALQHLALPAVTLALGGLATIVRFTRAGMLDTLQQDFVFYERAVGYRWARLVWIFVLRNSVTATVTQIGLLFGGLIAGGVVVEAIFDWPGIGSYTVQAILTGDRQVMLAVTLLVGTVYAAVNILVDLVHGLLDPRLMEQG